MEKPKRRRTLTSPGLGDSGLRPKQKMPSVPPSSGEQDRKEQADAAPLSGDPEEPAASAPRVSTRRPRSRPPVRIDEVGDAAVAIASHSRRTVGRQSSIPAGAPRMLKTRGELASAPIDHRDAFVLSLIDGRTSTQGLVDLAAMPDGEVVAILDRLAKLGIVSLP